jgi:hypothetical protein
MGTEEWDDNLLPRGSASRSGALDGPCDCPLGSSASPASRSLVRASRGLEEHERPASTRAAVGRAGGPDRSQSAKLLIRAELPAVESM